MQITDLIQQMGGVQSVARELGITPQQAQAGAAELLPSILGGFKRQAQAPAGLEGLGGLLGQLGGGSLLDSVLSPEPTQVGRGNDVLGQIFGGKDVSRAVASGAAARSGLDPALLKKMLPLLAMMAAGYLARQQGGSQGTAPTGGGLGGLGGMLGSVLGGGGGRGQTGGGLGALLDLNGNGNPLDDVIGMLGGAKR